ncbi:Transcriptional regulatory protein ZraR [Fuerstiella marisgermanici]|uniref:Transcriptional regulatory protein ZraR n=2 Tax=Fuerstiella marisgermanici TaxID=1891926 RepID=A0A1P8WRK4_9PLAN|nr:Transcriptional regulatory protein ZraR [Fuerstiella marisgermanici]
MDSVDLLVLCSSQPDLLRNIGTRLASRFRLLESYSLAEASQMVQLHRPALALLDLRHANAQRFNRAWALGQNVETTKLIVLTAPGELTEDRIPVELQGRVALVECKLPGENGSAILKCAESLLTGFTSVHAKEANGVRNDQIEQPSIAEKCRTRTPALQQILKRLEVAARHDVTILLIGETGSGKTHLARMIHESSSRRDEPLLTVACGALPGELIESELFGHVKGAFTSAHADKEGKFLAAGRGTILLDEIDVLTPEQQVKLLRVIEDGLFEPVGSNATNKVAARIIAASNVELQPLVNSGRFRADLYYRLNTLSFVIPPLRSRLPDIEPLARHFVNLHAASHSITINKIDDAFIAALVRYPWPGNVREMENAIRSAVIYSQQGILTADTLPPNVLAGHVDETNAGGSSEESEIAALASQLPSESLGNRMELTEKQMIEQALLNNRFSRTKTAEQLGISRVTLYNKMKKYGMMQMSK